jgi:hypothetical protein
MNYCCWFSISCFSTNKITIRVPNSAFEKASVEYVNSHSNHFDIGVPSVFGLVTCPFILELRAGNKPYDLDVLIKGAKMILKSS